jgi:hypothetical protein
MVIVLISGQTKEYTKLVFPVFQWDLTSPSRLSLVNMEILKINIKNTKWPHRPFFGVVHVAHLENNCVVLLCVFTF